MKNPNSRSAPPIIRLVHAQAFASFLETLGTPTDRLFGRVGLPVHASDPGVFVPLGQAWALFDAAAQLEDPELGWHVGRFYGDNQLSTGLLSRIEHAPTLYQALKSFVRLVSAEASHLKLGILERPDDILFYTHYSTIKDWPGYRSSQAYQLEVYLDLIRHYTGSGWVPSEIGIEHGSVPRVAEEHFPGSRILTGQRIGYLVVPRACLHMPSRITEPHGERDPVHLAQEFSYLETLRALLMPHLPDGYPSARFTASLMGTSVRTLARRLKESGTTYRSVVDDVRFDAARRYLKNPDLRIGDVAFAVGFDDPAHFTRMFRRIAGLTPRQYRRAIQA